LRLRLRIFVRLGSDTTRKTVLIAVLTIGFLVIPFLIHAEVYKWIDDKGTVHFTDNYSNIPSSYREELKVEIRKDIQEEKIPLPTQEITPRSKEEETRKDIYGQDETFWREKVRPWKEQLGEATANFKNAHEKYMEKLGELSQRRGGRWTRGWRDWIRLTIIRLDRLRIDRAKYEAQIAEANEMLRKLSKEAEESKANPDWLK